MQQHVGVAMANGLPIVLDLDAADYEGIAWDESVRIVTKADAKHQWILLQEVEHGFPLYFPDAQLQPKRRHPSAEKSGRIA
jgi:hypothetical protein